MRCFVDGMDVLMSERCKALHKVAKLGLFQFKCRVYLLNGVTLSRCIQSKVWLALNQLKFELLTLQFIEKFQISLCEIEDFQSDFLFKKSLVRHSFGTFGWKLQAIKILLKLFLYSKVTKLLLKGLQYLIAENQLMFPNDRLAYAQKLFLLHSLQNEPTHC